MDIFNVLTMIGGLCLFLFGMNLMGQALERRAGGKLQSLLDKMTGSVPAGFLTGLGITAIIQSSSATTVMVVGFVNSGLMTLRQAINVIMGANVGTTVTAWLLSLAGISGSNIWVNLLKPSSFTPVLALIGIIFYMFCKSGKKKDTGMILLGFATLMFGMETMSGAVSGLKDVPAFASLFLMFKNPILGVLAGALLTGIIQSSSASVGILQALAVTGQVSYAAAIPIIMGQNIGTCVTALISSVGTQKNAKRAAVVHLMFNVIGVVVLLTAFWIVKIVFAPAIMRNQRIIAGNAQFTGIAAGRGVGFTTGLLLLRKGLGMRETPIRPHSWHCRMQSGYQYGGNRKRPPVWRRHRGSLRPRGRNLGGVEGMTGGCGSGCDPAIHTRRLRVYHRPRRLRMASRISIFFAARRFEPLNSMG